MTTILNGLLGGLVVGLVAAGVTQKFAGDPSATARVLERVVGHPTSSRRWAALAVQIVYGWLAGTALVAIELFALGMIAIPPTASEGFGLSIAWSALLFGILVVVSWLASSSSLERSQLGELLVFRIGFGIWIVMTWIT